jgi:hypothetical protein
VLIRGREDPLIDLVVDEARRILYTLSMAGNVSVYDLGDTGDTTNLVCTLDNVAGLAERLCPRVKTQQWNKAVLFFFVCFLYLCLILFLNKIDESEVYLCCSSKRIETSALGSSHINRH